MYDVSAIDQVLLLAKNARGLTSAIDFISDALSRTDLFVFGELIDLPIVQQLKSEQTFQPWYNALELFAYETWQDYRQREHDFPSFSPTQIQKLKQLTVISLAQSKQVLFYSELKEALDFSETRELEDFLINSCFYVKILEGKLDQANEKLMVQDAISRDTRPEDLPKIKNKLKNWVKAAEACLDDIFDRIQYTQTMVQMIETRRAQLTAEAEKKMKEIKDVDGMRMDTSDTIQSYFEANFDERDVKPKR